MKLLPFFVSLTFVFSAYGLRSEKANTAAHNPTNTDSSNLELVCDNGSIVIGSKTTVHLTPTTDGWNSKLQVKILVTEINEETKKQFTVSEEIYETQGDGGLSPSKGGAVFRFFQMNSTGGLGDFGYIALVKDITSVKASKPSIGVTFEALIAYPSKAAEEAVCKFQEKTAL